MATSLITLSPMAQRWLNAGDRIVFKGRFFQGDYYALKLEMRLWNTDDYSNAERLECIEETCKFLGSLDYSPEQRKESLLLNIILNQLEKILPPLNGTYTLNDYTRLKYAYRDALKNFDKYGNLKP